MPAKRERAQEFSGLDRTRMYGRQLSIGSYIEKANCSQIKLFLLGGDAHEHSAVVGDLDIPRFAI